MFAFFFRFTHCGRWFAVYFHISIVKGQLTDCDRTGYWISLLTLFILVTESNLSWSSGGFDMTVKPMVLVVKKTLVVKNITSFVHGRIM